MVCLKAIVRPRRQDSAPEKVNEPSLTLPPCCLAMSGPSNVTQEPVLVPSTDPEAVQPSMPPDVDVVIDPPTADQQPAIVADDEAGEADTVIACPLPHHKRKKPFGYKICGFFQHLINQFPIPCRICCYLWCPCCIPCPLPTEQAVDGEPSVHITAEAVVDVPAEHSASPPIDGSSLSPKRSSILRPDIFEEPTALRPSASAA
ncbi:hypothetical protein SEPCBS119000_005231 [Sporothrix epigloea]|uniref:Uncharacterized protein n=1 Tax=Sporothrix epigloea TaxID=1892477 RepID=A0ABP0DYB7_9PEZI